MTGRRKRRMNGEQIEPSADQGKQEGRQKGRGANHDGIKAPAKRRRIFRRESSSLVAESVPFRDRGFRNRGSKGQSRVSIRSGVISSNRTVRFPW
ncbi:MAG: hypothetical protein ACLFTV_18375 [Desulfococcaceae bacterium]